MTYHQRDVEVETGAKKFRFARIAALVLIIGVAICTLIYRDALWTRVARVLASSSDDPIPTQRLKKVAFQLEVPALGEVTGLKSVPLPTPSTRTGALKVAWLIPEGSFVRPGDTVVRFDSTDARLNLEKHENTLEANQERMKITAGKQATDERVLGIDRTDAEKEYDYAMTVLPQDETIFSKWDIIEAKINANFAKERINFLTNKGRVQKRIARSDTQILAIEKNRAQSEIAIAKQTLDSLELKTAKPGLVLYRRDRMRDPQVGDESWPGQVLVELVDLRCRPGYTSWNGMREALPRAQKWSYGWTRFPKSSFMGASAQWPPWHSRWNETPRSNISPARLSSGTPIRICSASNRACP